MELTDANTGQRGKRQRKTPLDLSTMVYGKVPPQARDLEEAILGALMLDKFGFDIAIEILKPKCFYVDAHQRIFQAIIDLNILNKSVDIMTVVEQLRFKEELDIIGGPYYITKLTNTVVNSSHIETHSRIVFQKFIQREIIRVGGEMISEGYEDSTDAFQLLDNTEGQIFAIANGLQGRQEQKVDALLIPALQKIQHRVEEAKKGPDHLSGVPSGFRAIDGITHGWQPTDLIILAARPSVGKTALALNLARNAAMNFLKPTATAFFSLEMSTAQLIERLISAEAEIPLDQIKKGRLEENELENIYLKAIQKLHNAPLYIDDTASLNIFELRAKCRRMKATCNLGLIIIDYLQLMSGVKSDKATNREQEISNISRALKALAKELEVPIIALSQLSREVEKRKDFKPNLSDLRESGAIEQDADTVCFIYRPEYHGLNHSATGESNVGETMLKFAKHRNGVTDEIKLTAKLWIQKFVEYEGGNVFSSPLNKGNGIDFRNIKKVPQIEEGDLLDLPF